MNFAQLLDTSLRHSQIYNFFFAGRTLEAEPVILHHRRVFILPTLHGVTFAMALILMLIGSVNYALSLGFLLTFLLAGVSLVGLIHNFRNLVQLRIKAGRSEPVFAGGTAQFALQLDNPSRYDRFALVAQRSGTHRTEREKHAECNVDVPAQKTALAILELPADRRGWLPLGRVTVETRYPLAICRAWGYAYLDARVLVYPRPDITPLPIEQAIADQGNAVDLGFGSDDFLGLRAYQSGDSPRHIAWKLAAREEAALLIKQFSGRGSSELWLEWDALPVSLDTEAKLSRLSGWVLQAEERQQNYGLRLPGAEYSPEHGTQHRDRCLKALALFGLTDAHEIGVGAT